MFRIVDDKGSWELSRMIDITRGRVGEHPWCVLYLSLLVSPRKEMPSRLANSSAKSIPLRNSRRRYLRLYRRIHQWKFLEEARKRGGEREKEREGVVRYGRKCAV